MMNGRPPQGGLLAGALVSALILFASPSLMLAQGASGLSSSGPASLSPVESSGGLAARSPSTPSRSTRASASSPSVEPVPVHRGWARRLAEPLTRSPEIAAPSEDSSEAAEPAPEISGGEQEAPWSGPQLQFGYSFYRLSDGYGGGDVHGGSLEVFLPLLPQLRLGLAAELGARDYSLAGDDLIIRGEFEVGAVLAEVIDPFRPYLSLVVTLGGVLGERFETTTIYGLGGAGPRLGFDLRVVRDLHLSASLTYLRLEMDGAAFDSWVVHLGVGI